MAWKLLTEFIIPAEYGKAFRVVKGQSVRITAVEGPQVGDLAVFNAHDYTEIYDPDGSFLMGSLTGTGNMHKIRYLYSRPPRVNLMLEVTDDKVGRHWVMCGGRCSPTSYRLRGYKETRSCQLNLEEAIAEFGMNREMVPDVLNLWMNVEILPDGTYTVLPARCEKGDYIDFLAHMDCLLALSSCPGNQGNSTPINGGSNKPLKVEVWEGGG